jgi:hypothetical protein
MSDTKVFIGGSRHLSRLSVDVKQRLDKIVESRFTVLIGDANGADKAVQTHFAARHYPEVVVFCVADHGRNNVGDWPRRDVNAPAGARGFALYSVKDEAMAREATHGFMLWDGESKGTLNNIVSLVKLEKPVVVFFGPTKSFVNVRTRKDVVELLAKCDQTAAARLERDLELDRVLHEGAPLV